MPIHQGRMLKDAVDRSKLRIQDISKLSGIPVSSLYDIFKKEDVPRKKLYKLCEILELDSDDFYFAPNNADEGKMPIITPEAHEKIIGENEQLKGRIVELERIIASLTASVENLTAKS
jgi:predicted transcriptional regulator